MSEPESMNVEEKVLKCEIPEMDIIEVSHDNGSHPERKRAPDAEFELFQKEFQEEVSLEQKIHKALLFMEKALSQGNIPNFRHFWDARSVCLPLFKENVSPLMRSQAWNKYCDLSKEARRLKDILDEQSNFASEQIEIAIKALEEAIDKHDQYVEAALLGENFIIPKSLDSQKDFYEQLQKQLNLLNSQATHINALRKELLKTDMRVRQKNKFFQRLSLAGDKVFPKRKELIYEVSNKFIIDIDQFIKTYFSENAKETALFILREEIKALQGLAKALTLNTHAFTDTRMKLSQGWDQLKVKDKELKKERASQKASFKVNADLIQQNITSLKEDVQNQKLSTIETTKKIDEIQNEMRRTELGRDEVNLLRDQLSEIKSSLKNKAQSEEKIKQQQEDERTKRKREVFESLKAECETLVKKSNSFDADQLTKEKDLLSSQIEDSSLSRNEKQELERILKSLKDIITEKKEQAVLNLSHDDRQNLQQLQDILNQRKTRRQEIKTQLENLRKMAGSSSLDFEKAMTYNTQIAEEKERYERSSLGIKEIEDKISKLRSK